MINLFKLFKKETSKENNEEIEVVSGFFPSAKEAKRLSAENREILKEKYPVASKEEILKGINDSIIDGCETAVILNRLINEKDKLELESMGYEVSTSGICNENVYISWKFNWKS